MSTQDVRDLHRENEELKRMLRQIYREAQFVRKGPSGITMNAHGIVRRIFHSDLIDVDG